MWKFLGVGSTVCSLMLMTGWTDNIQSVVVGLGSGLIYHMLITDWCDA